MLTFLVECCPYFYGTHLWDCHWSLLDGNGTSVWADAELTNIGVTEAQRANIAWKDQIKADVPLPESYYSSPLRRAASTLEITWKDITLNNHKTPKPIVKEELRETIGIHTCDRRSSKTEIAEKFPEFVFEKGFLENDPYWTLKWREPDDVRDIRLGEALNDIFAHDNNTYISITAHSGAITSMLQVLGHRPFRLQTGGMIPVVVKVEFVPERGPTPTSVSPSYGAPSCTTDPITNL
ncbi:histidine phosphatase superfamily [Tuber indicum]|nr:histidine phosphatase superfamily [Tuber indicum]